MLSSACRNSAVTYGWKGPGERDIICASMLHDRRPIDLNRRHINTVCWCLAEFLYKLWIFKILSSFMILCFYALFRTWSTMSLHDVLSFFIALGKMFYSLFHSLFCIPFAQSRYVGYSRRPFVPPDFNIFRVKFFKTFSTHYVPQTFQSFLSHSNYKCFFFCSHLP